MNAHVEFVDRQSWDSLSSRFRDLSFTHCWDYGVAGAKRVGAVCEHTAIVEDGRVLGIANVRIKRPPVLRSGIAYVNGGPVTRLNGDALENFSRCVEALRAEYVEKRGFVLRILAPIGRPERNAAIAELFRAKGFVPAPGGRRYQTVLLDLDRPEDEIRSDLGRRWRRHLRQAERAELEVREGIDAGLLESFWPLYSEMRGRKEFHSALGPEFYSQLQEELPDEQKFLVSIAHLDGVPAAGTVMSYLGDTCVYLLGASNAAGRKARASYLLHWRAIQTALQRGLRWYDLGGIDREANPGVYTFKTGMGGFEAEAAGPLQAVPESLSARLTLLAERLYRGAERR